MDTDITTKPPGSAGTGPAHQDAAAPNSNPSNDTEHFHFFSIDPNERLTRPPPPEKAEFLSQAEQMVSWAISSKHENAPAPNNNVSNTPTEKNTSSANKDDSVNKQPIIEAAKCHSLLINMLTRKSDPALLHASLHGLLSSNHGRELDRLVSYSKLHAQTIHLIMRLDPFVPSVDMMNALAELEGVRRERGKSSQGIELTKHSVGSGGGDGRTAVTTTTPRRGVQIAESSIVYKEDQKYIVPTIPFFNYQIADVHLYLIVALVSNNSLLGVSAVRAIWKMLTDFGYKWVKEKDEEKKRNKCTEQKEQIAEQPPPTKRRKVQSSEEKDSTDLSTEKEAQEIPEGLKLVPGMNGLSVDFVRDVFYGNIGDGFYENICSDQLPRGRVKRLLLALVNIFRLNNRSKTDLLHEMSTNFPHYKTTPLALHRWYINMCLQIVHLVPTLEGPIVNVLVDQALEMDVQIKINDNGGVFLDEDEDKLESTDQDMSSKKRSYHIISQETTSASKSASKDPAVEEGDQISEIAERLDNLMNVLCQRIQNLTSFSSDSVSEALAAVVNARRLYRHLDEIFDKKVRLTHRSKFVPFLLFVLFGREHDALNAVGRLTTNQKNGQSITLQNSNLQDEKNTEVNDIVAASISQTDFLYRDFCAKLIELFYNPVDAGELPSQTVVCCLASLVSRATYVCSETVCETVAAILQWVETYIDAHTEAQGTMALVRRQSSGLGNTLNQRDIHALFYTACQSAFYIMCFRGAEALHYYQAAWRHKDDPESRYASPESVNLGAKRWKAICKHPLQPLKYCLESVRVEFLHMAEDLNLFVDDSDCNDSHSQQDETKQFIQSLWSANDQGKSTGQNKLVTPKRKRSSIISTAATQEKKRLDGGVGGLGKGSNPLDSYFPFDPYLLKSSYKHVHPFYRNWEDCILSMDDLDDATTTETSVVDDDALIQEDDNDAEEFEDEDDNSILTDSEADNAEEEDSEDESDDEESKGETAPLDRKKSSQSLGEGNGLEVEIRRCRAMSTGSQASW